MTLKQAFFILRHGSSEREHKYLEAVKVIEDAYDHQKADIEALKGQKKPITAEDPATTIKRARTEAVTGFAEEVKRFFSECCKVENMSHRQYRRVADYIDRLVREKTEGKADEDK